MVNTEEVQNPAAAGDIHNQPIHQVGQETADHTTARLTREEHARQAALRQAERDNLAMQEATQRLADAEERQR